MQHCQNNLLTKLAGQLLPAQNSHQFLTHIVDPAARPAMAITVTVIRRLTSLTACPEGPDDIKFSSVKLCSLKRDTAPGQEDVGESKGEIGLEGTCSLISRALFFTLRFFSSGPKNCSTKLTRDTKQLYAELRNKLMICCKRRGLADRGWGPSA